nr:2OG-Fe(II) oxygenase [Rhodopirellula sp. SM50]
MSKLIRVNDEVFMIADLCSAEECDHWIAHGESLGYEQATVNSEHGPRRMPDVRNNARVIFDDPKLADHLWQRIATNIPYSIKGRQAVGLNERLRYYRYDVGQKFDWHADGCVRLDGGVQSLLTFLIYLNDNFSGGETRFRHGVKIEPKKGMALLFCHWQKHTGKEVLQGRKYVLRSDVLYKKSDHDEVRG